ncbi:MAG: 3-oxoacyl-ACP synthase [Treponema sp.]|nr:3-oxoacyl-ACP synthase [Treponema sp.]
MKKQIFLSNPGVLCACAKNSYELWSSCIKGEQSGIVKVNALSGKEFFAGKVDTVLQKTNARFDTRLIQIANFALSQIEEEIFSAIQKYGKNRVAVCCGSCDNGTELSVAAHKHFVETGSFPENYSLEMQGADYPSSFIAEKYDIGGATLAFSTACSSSAVAIIKAAELIQAGFADAVIAGGVDIVSSTVLLGFDSLEAVSSEITNPFSKNRKGITLGEGAAFFVLAKDAFYNEPNVPNVKLLGYGESADAHHMTSPSPDGGGAEHAMRAALLCANILPSDVDYINLHGTGTKFNDSMEAKAVNTIFGKDVYCSATKPLTGHTLGAAGSLELAVCYNAIVQNALLPPHVYDGVFDNDISPVNLVQKNCAVKKVNICMSNSFAFGGSNASVIIGV